jgi:hypothetical protein
VSKSDSIKERSKRSKILTVLREVLTEYGCSNTETIKESVLRLIAEHKRFKDLAESITVRNVMVEASERLAIQTRDGAQRLADKHLEEARKYRWENEHLRKELDAMREEIVVLEQAR